MARNSVFGVMATVLSVLALLFVMVFGKRCRRKNGAVKQPENESDKESSSFVAQLNDGRHLEKRPTEFQVDNVLQPFDPTKVGKEEVLFCFEASNNVKSETVDQPYLTSVRKNHMKNADDDDDDGDVKLDTTDLPHKDSSIGALCHDVVAKTIDQPSLTTVSKNCMKKADDEDGPRWLKMEIKRTWTNRLPTIIEESKSIESEDDLREDPVSELHKNYTKRMRMLDILGCRIMLQNRPLHASSEIFVKELKCDLELVYVGQMCLSWEFLRRQYEKARNLSESESHIRHHYNQVAGEF